MFFFKIEPVQKRHLSQVIDLLQGLSVFLPEKERYNDIWNDFSSQANTYALVAVVNELVIGYGALVIEKKIRGGKMGHIEDVVAHAEYRSKGVGASIVNTLCDFAKNEGCYKVAIQCQQHNVEFYERCNYEISGIAMQRFFPLT